MQRQQILSDTEWRKKNAYSGKSSNNSKKGLVCRKIDADGKKSVYSSKTNALQTGLFFPCNRINAIVKIRTKREIEVLKMVFCDTCKLMI